MVPLPLLTPSPGGLIQRRSLRTRKSQFELAVTPISIYPPFLLTLTTVSERAGEHVVGFCKALKTLSRPFVLIGVDSHPVNESTVFIKVAFNDTADSPGLNAANSAAAPVTCGAAIEVPLDVPYELSVARVVLNMLDPGAARSVLIGPQFENPDRVSVLVEEATVRMLGDVYAAGYAGATAVSLFQPSFPAAKTFNTPASPKASRASLVAWS